jgi:preprotein translocase subunit YajC
LKPHVIVILFSTRKQQQQQQQQQQQFNSTTTLFRNGQKVCIASITKIVDLLVKVGGYPCGADFDCNSKL